MTNWDQVLEKARTEESKDWLAEYLPTLCSDETLEDPTKLRVLGNSLANNEQNRRYLLESKFAEKLLKPEQLLLSVLLNYCIDFPEGCSQLLNEFSEKFTSTLVATSEEARASAKHLTGVIAQELELADEPVETRRKIVLDGFIEFILVDNSLEVDAQILEQFPKIYQMALDLEDFNDATQVVGNITCHPNFTLQYASVGPAISPVFFIVLANLTGKLADVEPTMAKFPDGLQLVLDFIDSDDFEHDEYNSCAHFLRNVGRLEKHAIQISSNAGLVPLIEDLIESPFAEVAIQLAGIIGQHVFRYDLFEVLDSVEENPQVNAALLVAYSQLCIPLASETSVDARLLEIPAKKIVALLEATPALDQTVSLWMKGSKALALLSQHTQVPSLTHLEESAPKHEGIQQNFAAIKRIEEVQ